MTRRRWTALFLIVAVAGLAALRWPPARRGAVRVREAAVRAWLVATGGLVDVGGRRLRLDCAGGGDVTVVLDAGLCQSHETWGEVPAAVSRWARVCSYDRAGLGDSDPAPSPRSPDALVGDLHALLARARVPGPYVLVGHSFGGLTLRLYASRHPEQVAGLVLVDASHEDQYASLAALMSPGDRADYLAHEGGQNCEHVDLPDLGGRVRAAGALPAVPLVVLSARERWPTQGCAAAQARDEMQSALASVLPGGRRVVAEGSGHFIQKDRPRVVVDAIREVVEAARRARR